MNWGEMRRLWVAVVLMGTPALVTCTGQWWDGNCASCSYFSYDEEKTVIDARNVVGSPPFAEDEVWTAATPLATRYMNNALSAYVGTGGVYRPQMDISGSENQAYMIFDVGGTSNGLSSNVATMNRGGGYVKVKNIHITWDVDNRNRSHTNDVACLNIDQEQCNDNPCCMWSSGQCSVNGLFSSTTGSGTCNENIDRCEAFDSATDTTTKNAAASTCQFTRGANYGKCDRDSSAASTITCTYVPGQAPQDIPGIPSHSVPETFQILSSMSNVDFYTADGTSIQNFCPCDAGTCTLGTQGNEGPGNCDMASAELVLNLTLPYDRQGNPEEYSLNGGSTAPSYPIVTTVRKDVIWNGNVSRDDGVENFDDSHNFPGVGPWGSRSTRDIPVPVPMGLALPQAQSSGHTFRPELVTVDTMSVSFEDTQEGFLTTRYLMMKYTIPDHNTHRVGIHRIHIETVDDLCGPHRLDTGNEDTGPPMELAVMPLQEGEKNEGLAGKWLKEIDWYCNDCYLESNLGGQCLPGQTHVTHPNNCKPPAAYTNGTFYARPGQTLRFHRTSDKTDSPRNETLGQLVQDITMIPGPFPGCLPPCDAGQHSGWTSPQSACASNEDGITGVVGLERNEEFNDVFVKSEWVGQDITFQSRDLVDLTCLRRTSSTETCHANTITECDQGLWITVHVLPHLQCEAAMTGTWNEGNDPSLNDNKNYSLYPEVDMFGCIDEGSEVDGSTKILGTCHEDMSCSSNCISTLAPVTGGTWLWNKLDQHGNVAEESCSSGIEVEHMSTCSLQCGAGFRPAGSVPPKCAYGTFTKTTNLRCDAIPCPAQSHTSDGNPGTLGEGCVCVTGSSGSIVATTEAPHFYTGFCQDTEECEPNPCGTHSNDTSTCSETSDGVNAAINTYFCDCPIGYTGGGVETSCVEVTVENGVVSSDKSSCTCNAGYVGCGDWSGTGYPACTEVECAPYEFASNTGVLPGANDGCTDGIRLTVFSNDHCTIQCDDDAGYIPTTSTVECPDDANIDGTTIPTSSACHKKDDDEGLEPWIIGVIAGVGAISIGAIVVAVCYKKKKSIIKPVAQLDMTGDGKVDHIAIDTTGDGVADTVVDLSKSGSVKPSFNIDRSGDGHVDEVAIDTTGDGMLDTRMAISPEDSAAK